MKTVLTPFIVTISILALLTPTLVSAVPVDAPSGSTLQQRVDLRKKEQKTKLTEKELTRYKSRCTKTQAVIRDVQAKLGETTSNRQAVYKKIDAKLWIMVGMLKLAEKDTFKLEAQRTEFAKKVVAYSNSLNQYNQVLDDIVVMNCQADPLGFVALVTTARQYHTSIRAQSVEIKSYVVDTIKKSLSEFSADLEPKTSTGTGE